MTTSSDVLLVAGAGLVGAIVAALITAWVTRRGAWDATRSAKLADQTSERNAFLTGIEMEVQSLRARATTYEARLDTLAEKLGKAQVEIAECTATRTILTEKVARLQVELDQATVRIGVLQRRVIELEAKV